MSRLKPNFTGTLEKAKKEMEGSKKGDERFWYPRKPKTEDALYKFAFIPSKPDEEGNFGELCFEKIIYHDFEYLDKHGKKRFWRRPCNKMIGQDCPICDKVGDLWDKSKDETRAFSDKDKALRDLLKLKHRYLTNIYIIEDPADETNKGKSFLTLFPAKGKALAFDNVLKHLNPSPIDLQKESFLQFNPYDPFKTAVFLYHYQAPVGKEKYGNYDGSEFGVTLRKIAKTDEKIEEILYAGYDLEEYIKEYTAKAKNWDEIIMEIGHILEGKGNSIIIEEDVDVKDEDLYDDDVQPDEDQKNTTDKAKEVIEEAETSEIEEKELEEETDDDPPVEHKANASDDDVLSEWED